MLRRFAQRALSTGAQAYPRPVSFLAREHEHDRPDHRSDRHRRDRLHDQLDRRADAVLPGPLPRAGGRAGCSRSRACCRTGSARSRGSWSAGSAGRGSSPRARRRWAASRSTAGSRSSGRRRSSSGSSTPRRSPSRSSSRRARTSREIVDRVMRREHPRLWADLPPQLRALGIQRVQRQLPEIVRYADRADRRAHRPARGRQADGDQALRPGARQPRVPRDGAPRAEVHPELRVRVRLRARDPGRGR